LRRLDNKTEAECGLALAIEVSEQLILKSNDYAVNGPQQSLDNFLDVIIRISAGID
jgi:hypothetical protein